MSLRYAWKGLKVGTLVAIPAIFAALESAGVGHGDYGLARLLFPYTMRLSLAQGESVTQPLILLALVQYPLCGAAVGWAYSRGRVLRFAVPSAVALAHVAAAILCFTCGAFQNLCLLEGKNR